VDEDSPPGGGEKKKKKKGKKKAHECTRDSKIFGFLRKKPEKKAGGRAQGNHLQIAVGGPEDVGGPRRLRKGKTGGELRPLGKYNERHRGRTGKKTRTEDQPLNGSDCRSRAKKKEKKKRGGGKEEGRPLQKEIAREPEKKKRGKVRNPFLDKLRAPQKKKPMEKGEWKKSEKKKDQKKKTGAGPQPKRGGKTKEARIEGLTSWFTPLRLKGGRTGNWGERVKRGSSPKREARGRNQWGGKGEAKKLLGGTELPRGGKKGLGQVTPKKTQKKKKRGGGKGKRRFREICQRMREGKEDHAAKF